MMKKIINYNFNGWIVIYVISIINLNTIIFLYELLFNYFIILLLFLIISVYTCVWRKKVKKGYKVEFYKLDKF